MKKISVLLIFLLTIFCLVSCTTTNKNEKSLLLNNDMQTNENSLLLNNDMQTNEQKNNEVHSLNLLAKYDYGLHVKDKAKMLLDDNLIWFNPTDYEIETIVAGDEFVIKYTGECIIQETYPSMVQSKKMNIQSVEVIKADIVEFTLRAAPGIYETPALGLIPVDSTYTNYTLSHSNDLGYVVSKDGSFKQYREYPDGTTIYASLPKGTTTVYGLYDYNPRNNIVT